MWEAGGLREIKARGAGTSLSGHGFVSQGAAVMRIWSAVGVAVALIGQPALAAPSAAERGLELVRRNCAMCHAIGDVGASPNREAPPFRQLGRRYPLENLEEALSEGILTGHPAMPEYRFAPDEIRDLITYLKSIQIRHDASFTHKPA